MRNPGDSAPSSAAGLWISLITLGWLQKIELIPTYDISMYTEQPCEILKQSETVCVLHISQGSKGKCVHMHRMSFVCVGHKLKQSKLDFFHQGRGSPLASIISQTCPEATNEELETREDRNVQMGTGML